MNFTNISNVENNIISVLYIDTKHCVVAQRLGVGLAIQVAGSIPDRWLSRNIGQLSLMSIRCR